MQSLIRISSRNFTLGGKLTDHMAIGHGEGDVPPLAQSAQENFTFFFGGLVVG